MKERRDIGTEDAERRHPVIEVRDFGPIAQGKVELRPLTVFAGASNTGKSWLATLIYALWRNNQYSSHYPMTTMIEASKKFKKPPFYIPENPQEWQNKIESDLPIKLTSMEREYIKFILSSPPLSNLRKGIFEDSIQYCFGVTELTHLIRQNTQKKTATAEYYSSNGSIFKLAFESSKISCDMDPPEYIRMFDKSGHIKKTLEYLTRADKWRGENFGNEIKDVIGEVRELTHNSLFSEFLKSGYYNIPGRLSSAWYLPADRGGVMHARRAIVSALIQNSANPRFQPVLALSGVLSDFMDNLIRINSTQKVFKIREKRKSDLAQSLEKKVLKGSVEVEMNETNYPAFFWKPDNWDRSLSLLNASSMVSELTPVALYLRYHVSPGDLLILEEPEAHLHPSGQIELIREVALWVRSGLQVILTTHSEWVLEALANLAAESATGKKTGLDKASMGIWLFKSKNKDHGSHIREIKWNVDEGGFETGFEKAASDLHNTWANLVGEMD